MLMRLNKFLCVLLFCLLSVLKLLAQDPLPACPVKGKLMQSVKPMKEMKLLYDTIQVRVDLPATFKEVGYNEIIDSLGILSPVLNTVTLILSFTFCIVIFIYFSPFISFACFIAFVK